MSDDKWDEGIVWFIGALLFGAFVLLAVEEGQVGIALIFVVGFVCAALLRIYAEVGWLSS